MSRRPPRARGRSLPLRVITAPPRAVGAVLRRLGTVLRSLFAGATVVLRSVVRFPGSAARALVAPLSIDVAGPVVAETRRRDWFLLLDVAVAILLYILAAVRLIAGANALGGSDAPQVLHLLAAGGALPVALRRHRPLLAWQVVLVAVVVTSALVTPEFAAGVAPEVDVILPADDPNAVAGSAYGPQFVVPQVIAYLLCLYMVAARTTRLTAIGVWLWSLIGLLAIAIAGMGMGRENATAWTWSVIIVTLVPVFGHNVGTRRRVEADLQAQQRRNEEEQAARATLEERSRIARELHDVVAHNMSVIAIQAEAAPLRAPDDAEALSAEFATIRATALETLTEMRRILGVLRNREDLADTAPAPGIDQLGALIDKVAAAGMDVRIVRSGAERPVPPGVGVSVYRIVQESLSNVLRHAPGAAATVSLIYEDTPPAVRVRVENGPPPVLPPQDDRTGARHGLVGMRERTAMLHGRLTAEPTDGGGFVVEATLPLGEA